MQYLSETLFPSLSGGFVNYYRERLCVTMQLIRRAKDEGLSLRLTFFLMLIISIGITVILLGTTYHTIRSFHALSDATDDYIELQDVASSLLSASDYLTEEAQCYTVTGERRHMDNYFTEAEETRRRERAVQIMEGQMPDSEALKNIKDAMRESEALMAREYYAMMLILTAQGDGNVPAAMRDVALSPEDQALSSEAKRALGAHMLHDDIYYNQKNVIRAHLTDCIDELKAGTHDTQNSMEQNMHADLMWMTILIICQSLGIVLMLWLTTSLGINPLLKAVEHIKHDQSLPIMGAHEFRYLAGTYNKMYVAYKKSIENLSFKASHDELTGVYNRAGYDLIKRSVDLSTTAFLLFDADRFKQINDQNGHEVGDQILMRIATALKQNFRSDDYICRIGGDEFVVLMVHVDKNVRHLIESKVEQINTDLSKGAEGLPPITMSVGVSLCHSTGTAQEMFHEADIALYHVKDHGRNGCCFFEPGMRSVQTEQTRR